MSRTYNEAEFTRQAREQLGDTASADELAARVVHLRRRHFQRLAHKSALARRKQVIRRLIAANEAAAGELTRLGDDAA